MPVAGMAETGRPMYRSCHKQHRTEYSSSIVKSSSYRCRLRRRHVFFIVVVVISSSCRRCCRRCHHVVVSSLLSCRRHVVMSSLSSCCRCHHVVVVISSSLLSSCRRVVVMSSCHHVVVVISSSSSSSLCRHRLVVNIIVVIAEFLIEGKLLISNRDRQRSLSLFRQICLGEGQHQPTNPCSGLPMKTSTTVTTEDSIYLPETLPQADKSVARPYVIRAIYIWYTMDKAIRLTCVCMAIYQKKNLI